MEKEGNHQETNISSKPAVSIYNGEAETGKSENVMIDITPQLDTRKDSGWAWVINFGAAMHVFILVGLAKSYGLFFVQFLTVYDTNTSMMSIILAVQTTVLSISSLFVLNIGTRIIGNRKLIIIGGVISSLGYFLSSFAPNVNFLLFSQSFLYGFGCACTSPPIFLVLNFYFERRIGFAYSMVSIGGSIGSLVMPLVTQNLIKKYELNGALLIISGMILNNVIVGVLMRPFVPRTKHPEELRMGEETIHLNNAETKESLNESNVVYDSSICNTNSKNNTNDDETCQDDAENRLLRHVEERKMTASKDSKLDMKVKQTNNSQMYNSVNNLLNYVSKSVTNIYGDLKTPETYSSIQSLNFSKKVTFEDKTQTQVKNRYKFISHFHRNFSILRNHRLQSILFAAFFSFYGSIFIIAYIPAFAKDRNITDDRRAILLTIIGVCDLMARITLAFIVDSKRIRRNHILGTALGITGIATMLNPFYSSFETFIVYAVIYGCFGGIYFSVITLLIRESVGVENLPAAMSLNILTHGASSLAFGPLLGYIRDKTESYMFSFYLMGAGLILGSVAIFCEPIVIKLEEQRTQLISAKKQLEPWS